MMLIQVEIYSPEWIPGEPPQQQFHATLAASTSAEHLLTIGRKNGDVLLAKDKSISREHVILSVASGIEREKTILASTPEEQAACKEDDDGLCVILRNVGKLGTYLAAEEQREECSEHSNNDEGDSSGTDETDDDEAVQKSQMKQNPVPVSAATTHLFHGKVVRLQEVSTSLALKSLSKSGGRVVLQCGKFGSTIVLTRKVIEVLVSGAGPHGYSDWKKAHFYRLGLRQSSQFVVGQTSMVLCQKRKLNAKQLSAWSLTVPIVTYEFLYAYLDARKSPSDPLFPLNPKDFSPAADDHTFWLNAADPKLLSSCTLLSTAESDMEILAEAAGAAVKKLYSEGAKTSNAEMVKRAQLILDSTPHCFGVFEKRPKKLDTELQSKAELRLVKSDDFLSAIIEQVLPKDTEGKGVGRLAPQQRSQDVNVAMHEEMNRAEDAENGVIAVEHEESFAPPVEMETDDLVMGGGDDSFENQFSEESKPVNETNAIPVGNTAPIAKGTTHDTPEQAPKRRKMAAVSGTGWFRAAPKDRSAYVKQDLAAGLDFPVQVAVTEICPDLVLPRREIIPPQTVNRSGGPDFRAFRKNRIITVHSKIELRSVLPRESDQLMQEYEEQEASLAQQRMRADDLFRDTNQR